MLRNPDTEAGIKIRRRVIIDIQLHNLVTKTVHEHMYESVEHYI